ncbi:MAG: glycoside hydrolase family 88 protein [Clostridia bacterium]|nr:glycoside hydrolase family 88 protein [Clostridia bacterium]
MKRLISLLLSSVIMLTSLNIIMNVTCTASTLNNSTDTSADSLRFSKTELLIEQMLQEDGPENGSLWNMESTTAFKWSYINGCMASAMMQLYNIKGDERYKIFADNYMSPFISTSNNSTRGYIVPTNFKISNYTLDDLNSGKALIELIASGTENEAKYTNAVSDTLYTKVLKSMLSNKITAEGNLWHKNAYPYQVWLDGIYMETPFWLEYELEINNNADNFVTAANHTANQIQTVYDKLRNKTTGLYYHGYDAQADTGSGSYNPSSAMSWAETGTGHSASYWLRGTGWYAMALVDNIELMQKAEKKYNIDLTEQKNSLINIYTDLMNSVIQYQDNDTKLWYQVIDRPNDNYNYIETSGSAAMSYALMKGYNIGAADISFYNSGLEVFRSICDNKLVYTDSSQSAVNLNDICQTAGLAGPSSGTTSSSADIGPKHTSRDGSYDYYVSEKTVTNDAKGVAPLIFAYCQILEYNKGNEPETETTTNESITSETTTKSEITTETTTSFISHIGETIGGNGESSNLVPADFSSGTKSADETTANGTFTIKATSGKNVNVTSGYIDLKGIGNTAQRSIAVNITGSATLTVKFFNNSSSARTLAVENADSSYSITGEATAGGSESNVNTLICNITNADTYYVFSKGSGIKITEITVTYPDGDSILIGDVDLNGTINEADAALLLKHISNISVLTDEKQLTAGDCNMDNKHNILDVTAILKYIAK